MCVLGRSSETAGADGEGVTPSAAANSPGVTHNSHGISHTHTPPVNWFARLHDALLIPLGELSPFPTSKQPRVHSAGATV